ncbi:MAG TPA: glucose 1-dehydrogenase [Mycobacteriales bacterium]|jgi:NAD(P)-dependent dehydrogenase (short-subunit alcohol dehydrogenase family)|nr:glucose 1-dehydrogenase [Mycobacteriales bacterium]
MRFQDRTVIVTGGASGIGAVMAARFAAEGAAVVIAEINGDAGVATADQIPGARAVEVDVSAPAEVRALIREVQSEHGAVDVLVNNAAKCTDIAFDELTEAEWNADVDVTLKAAFLTSQAVLPGMVARGKGAIVNISSVNGVAYYGNEAYSAAKAGLLSLTRSLAVKYGPNGIRCNAVVPGTIRTPIWQKRIAVDPDVLDRAVRWYPLGRLGTAEDVSAAALFLASDEAAWITGVALPVDGGLLAGNFAMTTDIVVGQDPSM